MARKKKWVVEHKWTCSACAGSNLGRHITCQLCGKPKQAEEKYDESNAYTAPAVTDEKIIKMAQTVGVNWSCPFCSYVNRGNVLAECVQCGAKRANPNLSYEEEDNARSRYNHPELPKRRNIKNEHVATLVPSRLGEVKKQNLRPETAAAFDDGVMSNDQMMELLRGGGPMEKTEEAERRRRSAWCPDPMCDHMGDCLSFDHSAPKEREREFDGGGYRTAPKVTVRENTGINPPNAPEPPRMRDAIVDGASQAMEWRPSREARVLLVGAAMLALGVAAIAWFVLPWEEHVTVSATSWSRTTHLQQRVTRHEAGAWGSPPGGSFNAVCETRQHGTHRCNPYSCNPHSVSYECNCHQVSAGESCSTHCSSGGNGFSHCEQSCTPRYSQQCSTCSRTEYDTCYRQCPTYEDWCAYDYYEWPEIAQQTTRGSGNDPVVWPALAVSANPPSPQRLVRQESYSVRFHNSNDDWTHAPTSVSEYTRFRVGAHWDIKVNHAGSVTPLHSE